MTIHLGDAVRPVHVGLRTPRREDPRLLTGRAMYVADVPLAGALEVAFVRSQVAHARLLGVDGSAALALPGVHRVVAATDLVGMSAVPDTHARIRPVRRFPLVDDRIRYVGAPIAAVLADDRYLAEDGAELVTVDLEELPVVASVEAALADGAPRLYEDWPDNRILEIARPNPELEAIFAAAARVVRGTYRMGRHTSVPLETRGAAAEVRRGRLTVWTSTQVPHQERTILARMLGLPESDIQVIAPDVGGGFGCKLQLYPEDAVVAWLALRSGRPVRWIEDRREHLIASVHARDERVDLEGAVDAEGRLLALRARVTVDVGSGETFPPGTAPALVSAASLTGAYRIPRAGVSTTCVVTNKTPSGAYRGFGTPEMIFAVERFLDDLAAETGRDRFELRRELVLGPEDLPYETASGRRIDSGSHREALERATAWALERRDHHRAARPGTRIGIGVANYIEGVAANYFPNANLWTGYETATVRMDPEGRVTVSSGVMPSGQGLETMLATLAADSLGLPIDDIVVRFGDTDLVPYGLGSFSSRSTVVAAGALSIAAGRLRDKILAIAAHLLEAPAGDLVIEAGSIHVRGTDAPAITVADVARTAYFTTFRLPPGVEPGLEATAGFDPPGTDPLPNERGKMNACLTWANSCQAAVVSVDAETGEIRILDFLAVHDAGPILNPLIVDGQVHGGVVQGLGGALTEDLPYSEDGQPLATSLLDYLLPGPTELPHLTIQHLVSPSPNTPFGLKGAGEAGVTGVAAAIGNAVTDALADLGVRIDRTPMSPAAIRGAIRTAAHDHGGT